MLWVEQPVGTGFSQGKVEAKNEYDVADEFNSFFKNWEKLFGIKNYKIYITVMSLSSSMIRETKLTSHDVEQGESYAGLYIPYISAGMLD